MPLSKTILVVDDSSTAREMVSLVLRKAGYGVKEAGDGREALAVLGDNPVGCVLTDLNMPIMDGLELTRSLRADPTHRFTPILILTTESENSCSGDARRAGATGWLIKPILPRQLVQTIARMIGEPKPI